MPSSRQGLLLALTAVTATGCEEQLRPLLGPTSLEIELVSPSSPGDEDNRLPDDARTIELRARALDAQNEFAFGFTGDIDVYAHYLGSLTPGLGSEPLASVRVTTGESPVFSIQLPQVFGPTFLWVEHGHGPSATFATGTSDILWFRDPFLSDVSRPPDEADPTARERSPLEGKEVAVSSSRYGARGRLIVTGVYTQGYTVSDVECQDDAGTPPCVTGDYDHMFVFSFSQPAIEGGGLLQVGHAIDRVNGAVSEFNGLTEMGFPQTFAGDDVDPARVPPPIVIQRSWLESKIELERAETALVAIDDAEVCPLDDDFETFSQWKLDVGNGCNNDAINVITKGVAPEFDPAAHVGQSLPRVVGTLRPINIGNFNVWIVFPRDSSDLVLP